MNKYFKLENYKFKFNYYKDMFFYRPFYNLKKIKANEIKSLKNTILITLKLLEN